MPQKKTVIKQRQQVRHQRFGFEIHGRAMLPLWPVSRPLDEEQPAVSG